MEPISETMDCDTDPAMPGQQRRVIRRVYKVQYRPNRKESNASSSGSQRSKSGSQKQSNLQRGKSMKAFDQSTDADIFALGSAFKDGNFQIDDFLKSWTTAPGFKLQKVTCTTQKNGEEATTREFTSTSDGGMPPLEGLPMSDLASDGALFPYVRRERILSTTGPELPKHVSVQTNDDSGEETYDNLSAQLQPLLPQKGLHGNAMQGNYGNTMHGPSYTTTRTGYESTISSPVYTTKTIQPSSYGNRTPLSNYDNTSRPSSEISSQYEPERKPLLPSADTSSKPPGSTTDTEKCENFASTDSMSGKKEVRIEIGESESDTFTDSSADEAELPRQKSSASCPFYSPKKRLQLQKNKRLSRGVDLGSKGKVGMTASEIPLLGEEKKLPAVQQMVMNYNRMLDSYREQFVETLFRAVKLNGVDVVKILVQLVLRKQMKLSSDDMREPESSATVLHVALLYDHAGIVEYLIDIGDCDLIIATYTKDEYKNQTALHVAVANGNEYLVNKLLSALHRKERKLLMNTVATGSYFQTNHPDGQLCLTAAAWAGNFDMLITLARHGANLTLKNMDGNTVMHRIVESSALHPDKMDYEVMVDKTFEAVGEWAKHCNYKSLIADQIVLEQTQKQISTFQRLLNTRNHAGLTPLALAAQAGTPLLQYILNMEKIYKIPQTKLGSISWVTYDVSEVSSFANDSYNKFSVLHILAHNSGRITHSNMEKEADIGFLDLEPIKTILAMKWSVYRWVYIFWCLLHLFVHIVFTYETFDKNTYHSTNEEVYNGEVEVHEADPGPSYEDHADHADPINPWFGVFIILPIIYIILELVDLFGIYPYSFSYMNMSWPQKIIKRIQSEWVITGNGPYRCVMMAYSILTILWFVLYLECSVYQNTALAMSLLMGWIFVLFFTRGCRVTSRFSIMIQKMFFRDLMYFLAVYVIILIAFSFSMNAMYTHLHQPYVQLPRIFYRMMNIVTELDQKETLSLAEPRHPLFTKMLMIMYAIVAVILLMNMLIAMMNTSYEAIRITRSNLWKQQQLSILLLMERRLFWIKWLCRRSENNIWQKEWEEDVKSYLDVTITYF